MNLIQRVLLSALFATLTTSWASAASLSLQPELQTVTSGSSFSVNLVISGLGDGTAPALGDFEVNIAFDPAALSFSDYVLGPLLGDSDAFEALDVSVGAAGFGVVNIAEVSLLSVAELTAMQPSGFVLATLQFTASGLSPGDSTVLDIASVPALGDASGSPLTVEALSGTTISAVPLPAAAWLLGAALLTLAVGRRT